MDDATLMEHDISIEMILAGAPEVLWNDVSLLEETSEVQLCQYRIGRDLGMGFGASLALGRSAKGQAISGISLWVGDVRSGSEFDTYWTANRTALLQISWIVDAGMRGTHTALLVPLTQQERDCLTLLAIGMRPAEICWKLSISEKTLENLSRRPRVNSARGRAIMQSQKHWFWN